MLHSWDGDIHRALASCARSAVGVAGAPGRPPIRVAGGLLRVARGVAHAPPDATLGVASSPARLLAGVSELCLGPAGRFAPASASAPASAPAPASASAFASASACTSALSQRPPAALLSGVHAERIQLTMDTSAADRRTSTGRQPPGRVHTPGSLQVGHNTALPQRCHASRHTLQPDPR